MLHYLTVQDILWIHLQLSKEVPEFDYARLEDGSFFQFGYGRSLDLQSQAARFFAGFANKRPFQKFNEATAFVSTLAFLELNGHGLHLDDSEGTSWSIKAMENETHALGSLKTRWHRHDDVEAHEASVKETVESILHRFSKTIAGLKALDHVRS